MIRSAGCLRAWQGTPGPGGTFCPCPRDTAELKRKKTNENDHLPSSETSTSWKFFKIDGFATALHIGMRFHQGQERPDSQDRCCKATSYTMYARAPAGNQAAPARLRGPLRVLHEPRELLHGSLHLPPCASTVSEAPESAEEFQITFSIALQAILQIS